MNVKIVKFLITSIEWFKSIFKDRDKDKDIMNRGGVIFYYIFSILSILSMLFVLLLASVNI